MITISGFPYRKRAIACHQTKRLFRPQKAPISAPLHEKRAVFNPILAARLSMQLFMANPGQPVYVPSMEHIQANPCRPGNVPTNSLVRFTFEATDGAT